MALSSSLAVAVTLTFAEMGRLRLEASENRLPF